MKTAVMKKEIIERQEAGRGVVVELSPVAYLAVCGLVRDALLTDSDAAPILKRVAHELDSVTAGGMIPSELTEHPEHLQALRRCGFAN